MKIKGHAAGLALGGLMALWHTVWALLVLTGFAQLFMDFIYNIHFLNNPFIVGEFNLVTAVTLIVVTGILGYVMGWVFAFLWNRLHKGR